MKRLLLPALALGAMTLVTTPSRADVPPIDTIQPSDTTQADEPVAPKTSSDDCSAGLVSPGLGLALGLLALRRRA